MTDQRTRSFGSSKTKILFLLLILLSLLITRDALMVQDSGFLHVLQYLYHLVFSERTLRAGGLLMFGVVALITCGLMCCVVNDE